MQIGDVEQEPAGASMLEEIRRTAEHRLQEIEPLLEEAERLRDVLSVIEHHPHEHTHAQAQTSNGAQGAANGSGAAHASRTPKGANKRMILELVAQRPGITPAEIARLSGVKRTVVASTVSRLKRRGELEAHERGVRLPAAP